MNPLESRKRLLIAESELNRARLVGDMAMLKEEVRVLAGRAKSFGSIASSIAVLLAGVAAFGRRKPAEVAVKPSWIQMIVKGAGLVSNFWLALPSRNHNHDDKPPNSRT